MAANRSLAVLASQLSAHAARLPTRPAARVVQARRMSVMCSPGLAARRPSGSSRLQPAAVAARRPQAHQRLAVRCLAGKGSEKSWSEIAAEAAELGK